MVQLGESVPLAVENDSQRQSCGLARLLPSRLRAHLFLDPSSVSIARWLGYLDLTHHLGRGGLLLFHAVGIVFGLETAEIDLYIFFRHGKTLVSKKLFDCINIDPLLDHIGGYRF
jgi:hypothetical protein